MNKLLDYINKKGAVSQGGHSYQSEESIKQNCLISNGFFTPFCMTILKVSPFETAPLLKKCYH